MANNPKRLGIKIDFSPKTDGPGFEVKLVVGVGLPTKEFVTNKEIRKVINEYGYKEGKK